MWTSKLEKTKRKGWRWLMRHPAVHNGFLKAWAANGLSNKVLDRVKELVESRDVPRASIRLILTGIHVLRPDCADYNQHATVIMILRKALD